MIKQLHVLAELETLVEGDTLDQMSHDDLKDVVRKLAQEVSLLKYAMTSSDADIGATLAFMEQILDRKSLVQATQYAVEMYDSEFFSRIQDRILASAIANFLINYFLSKGQQPQTTLWASIV